MDFNTFFRGGMPTFASNTSEGVNGTRGGFQSGMMDSLMPFLGMGGGSNPLLQIFMLVYNVLGARLGFDPTSALTFFGFLWAANKVCRQLYAALYRLVNTYVTANVHISSSDEMYLHVMKFLASQPSMVALSGGRDDLQNGVGGRGRGRRGRHAHRGRRVGRVPQLLQPGGQGAAAIHPSPRHARVLA
jgi:hypothetical protein